MSPDDDLLERAQARVGTTINAKWHVDRLIGAGGMAVVYAATHRNNKRAALKLLHPDVSLDPGIRARFLREGYAANTVDHPGVVRVDDDDVTEDGATFIVMELLEGETADARQARAGGRLPAAEVLSIGDQLLDVLAAAHAKGIIHRDLKPENIFLRSDGVLKVLDFGIARVRESGSSANATRAGSLIGTPSYMAPEQARGLVDDIDARTDLWSVGATMFKLLTGHLVHEAPTVNEILARSILQPAPPISSVLPSIDPRVARVVDRSLQFDKQARYPDARAMQTALREVSAAVASHDDSPVAQPSTGAQAATPLRSAMPPPQLTTASPLVASTGARVSSQGRLALVGGACVGIGLLAAVAVHYARSAADSQKPAPVAESSIPSSPAPAATASSSQSAQQPDSGTAPVSISDLPVAADPTKPGPATAKSAVPAKTATLPTAPPPALTTSPPGTATAAPPEKDPFSRRR